MSDVVCDSSSETCAPVERDRARRPEPIDHADVLRLVHELRVHQLELEMQNEELLRIRRELEQTVSARTAELTEALARAEQASSSKSQFLAMLSHEIRTPMNCISGLAHLLLDEDVTPAQRRTCEQIEAATRHLTGVVAGVLDMAKIEAGVLQLQTADFDLHEVLDGLQLQIDQRLRERGLRYSVILDSVPRRLHGDATRLAQALLNYLGNALKFTESGSITLRAFVIGEGRKFVDVRFEVEDTGCGIEPRDQARLFRNFVQAGHTNQRRDAGTGLGLAITRQFAQLMEGSVGVTSTPGKGSTFWMTARFQKATSTTTTPPQRTDALTELRTTHAGARVLLADDDDISRHVGRLMLERAGLVVDVAENGRDALRMAQENDYALVLLDVQMPLLDGPSVARALRATPGRACTPLVALTAQAFHEDRGACLAAGMNEHLTKPIRPESLYDSVLAWLRASPVRPNVEARGCSDPVPTSRGSQHTDAATSGLRGR